MQLLSFPNYQQANAAQTRELKVLDDIVNNVQIQPNLGIYHPNYPLAEFRDEWLIRFQQLSLDSQNQYLRLHLAGFLHSVYYNSLSGGNIEGNPRSTPSPIQEILENNTTLEGLNTAFYHQLHHSNRGSGYFDPGWCVLRQEEDGSVAVRKNGLILHIDPMRHLQSALKGVEIGDILAVRMPRNQFDRDYYVAVGNAGAGNFSVAEGGSQGVNVFFNLTSEGAITTMRAITQQLNRIDIPFRFKVLCNPDDYDRLDSGCLCFEQGHYAAILPILEQIYQENAPHFGLEVPLFTKLIAPGLGLVEELTVRFTPQESFGMNRCQIVASGLLEARQAGDESPQRRLTAIQRQFSDRGLEWQRPYLNANAQDIYPVLAIVKK